MLGLRGGASSDEGDPLSGGGDSEIPSTDTNGCWGCFWKTLNFCNTFAVGILAAAVVFLFLQLQIVTIALRNEQAQIDSLQDQIQAAGSHIDEVDTKVEAEHSLTLFQMAGTFTLLTCLITMFHMSTHLRKWNEPFVQRKIVTILWMSPIYALSSFFSLLLPVAEGYLAIIKDFYEAYVVYTF